jgi:site-specific DNA-methyltransferase (adenine-specific)
MNDLLNKITQGDCLEVMKQIPDKSVDMILCDLPYGTTACKWDTIIPFGELWAQYERVIKDNGAIVLTASQPFTSALVTSNPRLFRYELIWEKTLATNFMLVKKQPAKKHENILVFYKRQPTYNPQMEKGEPYTDISRKRTVG